MDNIFKSFLYEAPENAPEMPPDAEMTPTVTDMSDSTPENPPELTNAPDNLGDTTTPNMPDVPDDSYENTDDQYSQFDDNDVNANELEKDLGLDGKISAIMNMNLYQRYLTLLNTINGQMLMIKNNSDVLFTISNDSIGVLDYLKKLDENIRLYIKNSFINENYSKNLLFFNKCLNLLKLLNDNFESDIKKGVTKLDK